MPRYYDLADAASDAAYRAGRVNRPPLSANQGGLPRPEFAYPMPVYQPGGGVVLTAPYMYTPPPMPTSRHPGGFVETDRGAVAVNVPRYASDAYTANMRGTHPAKPYGAK